MRLDQAYLRSQPQVVMSSSELPLVRSARLLRESLAAYQRGQTQAAQEEPRCSGRSADGVRSSLRGTIHAGTGRATS